MRPLHTLALAALAPIAAGRLPPATVATHERAAPCTLSAPDLRFVQSALTQADRAMRQVLRLAPAPRPWIVLYDTTCTWHVAPDTTALSDARRVPIALDVDGERLHVWALPHHGVVRLPDGDSMPVVPRASAGWSPDVARPYFVLALLEVFRRDSGAAADPRLEERLRSVVSHEMVHTRQLPQLAVRLAELRRRYPLPRDLDDNVIERRFGPDSAFRAAFAVERELLYAAAGEPDDAAAQRLTRRALELLHARRSRFFGDSAAAYGAVEDLFLNMEGIGEWVRYEIHVVDPAGPGTPDAVLSFIRGRQNDWVQDEGLALMLLVDRFARDWRRDILGPEMVSPVAVLQRAVRAP